MVLVHIHISPPRYISQSPFLPFFIIIYVLVRKYVLMKTFKPCSFDTMCVSDNLYTLSIYPSVVYTNS